MRKSLNGVNLGMFGGPGGVLRGSQWDELRGFGGLGVSKGGGGVSLGCIEGIWGFWGCRGGVSLG